MKLKFTTFLLIACVAVWVSCEKNEGSGTKVGTEFKIKLPSALRIATLTVSYAEGTASSSVTMTSGKGILPSNKKGVLKSCFIEFDDGSQKTILLGREQGGTIELQINYDLSLAWRTDGSGNKLVATLAELNNVRNAMTTSDKYLQECDLDFKGSNLKGDLSAGNWKPIGKYVGNNDAVEFRGTYDGGGYKIHNMAVDLGTTDDPYDNDHSYAGLFGYCRYGELRNIHIADDCSVKGTNCIGGVCGEVYEYATITGCRNEGAITGISGVGGVCGSIRFNASDCHNSGEVSGEWNVGGVFGSVYGGSVTACSNSGRVSGIATSDYSGYIGGICGQTQGCVLYACRNSGAVSGSAPDNWGIGGICGMNGSTSQYSLIACYNTGEVSGIAAVGGIDGSGWGNIRACYNVGVVKGMGTSMSQIGGITGAHNNGYDPTRNYNNNTSFWLRYSGTPSTGKLADRGLGYVEYAAFDVSKFGDGTVVPSSGWPLTSTDYWATWDSTGTRPANAYWNQLSSAKPLGSWNASDGGTAGAGLAMGEKPSSTFPKLYWEK